MKKNVAIVVIFVGGFLLLSVLNLLKEDKLYSETENRMLAQKPEFGLTALLKGDYTKEFEEYVTDQFVWRDEWILIKSYADLLFGKKEINGVYPVSESVFPAGDVMLLEKRNVETMQQKVGVQVQKLKLLVETYSDRYPVTVMLVPTADAIYREKLPEFAPYFDQEAFLQEVENTVAPMGIISVKPGSLPSAPETESAGEKQVTFLSPLQTLREKKEEYIYYRTDHHWTTLGAYYGYVAWAQAVGEVPREYETETVSEAFLGTLHAKTNLPVTPDTMELFVPKGQQAPEVYYDFLPEKKESFYETGYLTKKDKYSVFFGGNHAFIQIDTQVQNGKSLLLIKDSYANCFVPFLAAHYETIYVVDFRYYKGSLEQLLQQYAPDEIFVLFNVVHFVEEFEVR